MDKLTKDAMNMLEITERTADRCDIWQDRFIYWIAVAIYHLLLNVQVIDTKLKQVVTESQEAKVWTSSLETSTRKARNDKQDERK